MTPLRFLAFSLPAALLALVVVAAQAKDPPSALMGKIRELIVSGRFSDAETEARTLVADLEKAGSDSLETARAIDLLVEALWRGGEAAKPEARRLAEKAVSIKQGILGANDPEYAASLLNLGDLLGAAADHSAARPHYERVLQIRKRALGPDDPEIAGVLVRLGRTEKELGRLAAARAYYEKALEIMRKARGEEHPEVASILYNLANLLRLMDEYDAALEHYQRALAITEKAEGRDSLHVAWVLNGLANLHELMGDYAAARPLYDRSLRIREEVFGPDHPEVASSLNNLAGLLRDLGDYAEARSSYERALDIRMRRLGPDHLLTAQTLDNLASLLFEMGEYVEARPLSEEALAIRRRSQGSATTQVGTSLHHHAELLARLGEPDQARSLFEEALEVWKRTVGTSHSDYAWTLNSLAGLLVSLGDEDGARRMYEQALGIRQKALGPDHPDVAQTLEGLGDLLTRSGDISGSKVAHERALRIRRKALGPEHPLVAESLSHMAELLWRAGQRDAAFDAAVRAEAIIQEHARLTVRTLPERQALRYAAMRPPARDLALSLTVAGGRGGRSQVGRAWDAVIRSRALVLDEMAQRHRHVAEITRHDFELTQARQRLANLIVRGPVREPSDRYQRLVEEARRQLDSSERSLAEASVGTPRIEDEGVEGFAEISRALPYASSLIAYVKYMDYSLGSTSTPATAHAGIATYAAFVMTGEKKEVAFFRLGTADEIEDLASDWRAEAARPPSGDRARVQQETTACRLAGEKLRRRVWDPMGEIVRGSRRVFVVPDGALHLVSLAALPSGPEEYLIESAPLIHYLSAERDLLPSRWNNHGGHGLLALGGPAFDQPSLTALTGSPGRRSDNMGVVNASSPFSFRGTRSSCDEFQKVRFPPLPAAAREVDEIADLWRRAARDSSPSSRRALDDSAAEGGGAERLVGAAASESAFKTMAPGRRVVHVATHGFFLDGKCLSTSQDSRGLGGLSPLGRADSPTPEGENPLLLSGLALAGANRREGAGPEEDDGVLTAEEIAAMDLSSAEWVVLSACDTGAGEIKAGEGVFGLRRAFQIAGAGTLVMSLWSVEDEPARRWMKSLYEKRFLEGLPTDEAVREASRVLLRQMRSAGEGSHPFYWGGFVATGNWH